MFNRNKRRARACERAEPLPEIESDAQVGLIGCGLCRDFVGAMVEQRQGYTKVVGLRCLNCETTIPVGDGFVVWPLSPVGEDRP